MTKPTDQQLAALRVRIAELSNWTELRTESIQWADIGGGGEYTGITGKQPNRPVRDELPDFCNDLNAMHEAENARLTAGNEAYFAGHLCNIADGLICRSEAWRRAVALDRTLSKEPIL